MRRLAIVVAVVGVVLGAITFAVWTTTPTLAIPPCQPPSPGDTVACSTIDGFPVGPLWAECALTPASCDADEQLALSGFDARDPSHPRVVRVRTYGLDMSRVCGPVLCALPGYSLWVFNLADGTIRAIGVACPGIAPCRPDPHYGTTEQ